MGRRYGPASDPPLQPYGPADWPHGPEPESATEHDRRRQRFGPDTGCTGKRGCACAKCDNAKWAHPECERCRSGFYEITVTEGYPPERVPCEDCWSHRPAWAVETWRRMEADDG